MLIHETLISIGVKRNKKKPENLTFRPHDERQLFQEDVFWSAKAEWSRAQL